MEMRYATFGFDTPNLGDDVQALAAALLLPTVDALVDRDRLDKIRLSEPHHLIMNSWFAIKRYKAVPSDSLIPHYFSHCIGRDELINQVWLAHWKKQQPIGCRDMYTATLLKKHGIDAYFTGCLTTWMGRFFKEPTKREGIVFVDVPPAMERYIPEEIRNRAERITNKPIKNIRYDQYARWREVAEICDRIRTAEMVVTRRLHTALPCVGFGTPVTVYLNGAEKNRRRFSGHDRFMPIVFHDGSQVENSMEWIDPRIVTVPDDIEEHFQQLAATLGSTVEARWNSMAEFVDTLPTLQRNPKSLWC
jgi:hypothetical protein